MTARAAAVRRAPARPASSSPPATWTTALTRATALALLGTPAPTGPGSALSAPRVLCVVSVEVLGSRRVSTPRAMKVADNMGRAIRLINMG